MAANVPAAARDAGDGEAGRLAAKINHLFDTIRRPDGKQHSNDEVANAMQTTMQTAADSVTAEKVGDGSASVAEAAGKAAPKISATYLWLLRKGDRDNPTKRHLEALAAFFDVSPAYFFDDVKSRAIAQELSDLATLADAGVKRVATRLGGLSPATLHSIAAIVEHAREIEGLNAPASSAESEHPGA